MLWYGGGEENTMQQIEHKQRVTIYPLVDAIIREDMMNMEDKDNRTKFILKVIDRMMKNTDINLAQTCADEETEYLAALQRIPVENHQIRISGTQELAKALANRRVKILREQYTREQKRRDKEGADGKYDITLRIPKDPYDDLEELNKNWEELERGKRKGSGYEEVHKYYRREKEFIERILWCYAEKPANERERIYCGKIIEDIEKVLKERPDKRSSLTVTMRTNGDNAGEGIVYRVAPCSLQTDSTGSYYYLVGISEQQTGGSDGRHYASFRISRIQKIKAGSHIYVSDHELEMLQDRIKRLGVPYILGPVDDTQDTANAEKTVVRLTPAGWRMYLSILRNRPRYNNVDRPQPDEDGNVLLEFDCSERQIENYFYMYGADAYIVQPVSLRERFIQKYTEALQAYTSNVDS